VDYTIDVAICADFVVNTVEVIATDHPTAACGLIKGA
jgi:hypothetical protein